MIVYLPYLLIAAGLSFLIGILQSFAFAFTSFEFDSGGDYFFHCFSGTLDFVFPYMALIFALFLLPRDRESGFLRHLAAIPKSRAALLAHYYRSMFALNLTAMLMYYGAVSLGYVIFHGGVLSAPESALWIGMTAAVSLVFLFIQVLFLFWYFMLNHAFISLFIMIIVLLGFELISAAADLYAFFPTTNIIFAAEWISARADGFNPRMAALLLPPALTIVYSALVSVANLALFRKTNLLYVHE